MQRKIRSHRMLSLVLLATALGGGQAIAGPDYSLITTIPVTPTSFNTTGVFSSYDISFFDPASGLDYVADRSNNAVDVFSPTTNTQVGQIGIGLFTGATPSSDNAGPNGVVVANIGGTPTLYAGNGLSNVKVFNLNNNQLSTTISTASAGATTNLRADEMAFDPKDHLLIVANDAATPSPFVSLINTNTNTVTKQITFNGTAGSPNATGGIEQPVWDANTGKFYVSVPQIGGGTDPGGIAEIDPATGTVTNVFKLSSFGVSACGPAGLVQGVGNQLLVGCSAGKGSSTLIFDPTANGGKGSVVAQFPQVTGSDEVAFDPTNNRFFLAARDNPSGPVLGIIDGATDTFLQNVATVSGAHSVAVDPFNGEVLVPLGGGPGNAICPAGCIGVYNVSAAVPEPASAALLLPSVLGLLSFTWLRRKPTKDKSV